MSTAAPEIDPIALYLRLAERARVEGLDTAPIALATADAAGRPSVRIVLLRGVDARGFVFFTNYESRKGRELKENPRASLCQYWPTLEEQIRIEGPIELIDAAESDAYFADRPRESQLGAWASQQSAQLEGRQMLDARLEEVEQRFAHGSVPRPPYWGGIRVIPERIEFWYGRSGRLHDRLLYTKAGGGWETSWLYP
ncbi:MAG TPA: pyridoxamine 5'-phosphate oxidase [Vicinamibacterales bacterium]|nr:pyridoxamine 5'-phosphate oxidase [Vicinamibacterales bacterium]